MLIISRKRRKQKKNTASRYLMKTDAEPYPREVRHAPREQVHSVTAVAVSSYIVIQPLVSKLPVSDANIIRHGS